MTLAMFALVTSPALAQKFSCACSFATWVKNFLSCFQLLCFLLYFLIQPENFSSAEGIVQMSTPRSFHHPISLLNPTSVINLTTTHYHQLKFLDPLTDGSGLGNLTNIHLEIDGDTLKQGDF